MRTKRWKVYPCAVEREDGQRRWDEAYQFLLHCMAEVNTPVQFLLADANLLCRPLALERVDVLLPVRIG
jgi:hypothetical protein